MRELALKIAKLMKKNPEHTVDEIAGALDIDPKAVIQVLDEYRPDGRHAGPGLGGGWTEQKSK